MGKELRRPVHLANYPAYPIEQSGNHSPTDRKPGHARIHSVQTDGDFFRQTLNLQLPFREPGGLHGTHPT
ncbi:MAG: hypothetical protein ACYCTV_02155 [Leptospirales bacterium]